MRLETHSESSAEKSEFEFSFPHTYAIYCYDFVETLIHRSITSVRRSSSCHSFFFCWILLSLVIWRRTHAAVANEMWKKEKWKPKFIAIYLFSLFSLWYVANVYIFKTHRTTEKSKRIWNCRSEERFFFFGVLCLRMWANKWRIQRIIYYYHNVLFILLSARINKVANIILRQMDLFSYLYSSLANWGRMK